MKRTFALALAAALIAVTSASANANCTQTGTIVRVSGIPGDNFIYLRTGSLADHRWSTKTSSNAVAGWAQALHSGQAQVTITGNAATCPTRGTNRSMGRLVFLVSK